jgi:hypothetical protein
MEHVLHENRMMAISIGGCLLIVAGLLTMRIQEKG